MKAHIAIASATGLMLILGLPAFAQTSVGAGANGSVSVDAGAAGTVTTPGGSTSVDGSTSVNAGVDANANATVGGGGSVAGSADTDGDGVISPEERTTAEASGTMACGTNGLAGLMSGMTMADDAAIAAATKVNIVVVDKCSEDEVTTSLATQGATNARNSVQANATATAAIQARGATVGSILGATSSGDVLTVYLPSSALKS